MKAERRAETTWTGTLAKGQGIIHVGSGAVAELPVTWASRVERPDGKTSPEELIAAAHASCYAMALSVTLERGNTPATQLTVNAVCTLDDSSGAPKISTMDLTVRGKVPGLDAAGFQKAAQQAEQLCPVSNALRGGVQIHLTAHLEA
jgi:osmotically inducible protein OsmC